MIVGLHNFNFTEFDNHRVFLLAVLQISSNNIARTQECGRFVEIFSALRQKYFNITNPSHMELELSRADVNINVD